MLVISDNYHVTVKASGRVTFECAMSLAFNDRRARHYAESPHYGLILMDYVENWEIHNTNRMHRDPTKLEFKYNSETKGYYPDSDAVYIYEDYPIRSYENHKTVGELLDPVWNWLAKAEYEKPYDHDGSNKKGFIISTGDMWGHVGVHTGAICHIKPYWMLIGK